MSIHQKSDLIVMQRDMQARKQGYSANSYIQALQLGLPSIWKPNSIFQQDNAPIHTANKTRAYLRSIKLEFLENWPPYSPDLDPIEHLWSTLEQKQYELFQECETWSGTEEEVNERLEFALVEAFARIDGKIVLHLTESMQERVQAVINAEGWYTKY